jgi:hypothetical protein
MIKFNKEMRIGAKQIISLHLWRAVFEAQCRVFVGVAENTLSVHNTLYIHTHIYTCMCVCACARERDRQTDRQRYCYSKPIFFLKWYFLIGLHTGQGSRLG